MLCDSQLGEVSIITGLKGAAEFFSAVGKMYQSFGIHKKHSSLVPLPADKYEANIKSVADYIKSSVDEVKGITGKNTTNGPDGTVSSKTASSVQMLSHGSVVVGHDGGLFWYSGKTSLPSGLSNLNFVNITYVFVFSCYDDICHQ